MGCGKGEEERRVRRMGGRIFVMFGFRFVIGGDIEV